MASEHIASVRLASACIGAVHLASADMASACIGAVRLASADMVPACIAPVRLAPVCIASDCLVPVCIAPVSQASVCNPCYNPSDNLLTQLLHQFRTYLRDMPYSLLTLFSGIAYLGLNKYICYKSIEEKVGKGEKFIDVY